MTKIVRGGPELVDEELAKIGVHETRLSVVAANAPALAFYERLGFEPVWVTLRRRAT